LLALSRCVDVNTGEEGSIILAFFFNVIDFDIFGLGSHLTGHKAHLKLSNCAFDARVSEVTSFLRFLRDVSFWLGLDRESELIMFFAVLFKNL
jgi:hypothetical protein